MVDRKHQDAVYVSGMFIIGHIGMEGLSTDWLRDGDPIPGFVFTLMILAASIIWIIKWRQPWYTIIALFVPILGGVKAHEMAEDFTEKRPWFAMVGLLGFFATWGIISLQLMNHPQQKSLEQNSPGDRSPISTCILNSSQTSCDAAPECFWQKLSPSFGTCVSKTDPNFTWPSQR
jgi:hypothetical protein